MATATHDYLNSTLSGKPPTPGFLSAAIAGYEKNLNIFEDSFKEATAVSSQSNQSANKGEDSFLRSLTDAVFSPLFGSSPETYGQIRGSPSPTTSSENQRFVSQQEQVESIAFNAIRDKDFVGLQRHQAKFRQQPSPPRSESPEGKILGPSDGLLSVSLSQITNQDSASGIWSQHGQVTPPTDQSPGLLLRRAAISPSPSQPSPARAATTHLKGRKRKRNALSKQSISNADESMPRGQLKWTAQAKPSNEKVWGDHRGDIKRARCLERNRVAASKCRQKKKHWISSLENKADDFQNKNNQLSLMLSSLKDEVLDLKMELLKHTNCDCARIREFLNQEATKLSNSSYQQTSSRMSAPIPSRSDSIGLSIQER